LQERLDSLGKSIAAMEAIRSGHFPTVLMEEEFCEWLSKRHITPLAKDVDLSKADADGVLLVCVVDTENVTGSLLRLSSDTVLPEGWCCVATAGRYVPVPPPPAVIPAPASAAPGPGTDSKKDEPASRGSVGGASAPGRGRGKTGPFGGKLGVGPQGAGRGRGNLTRGGAKGVMIGKQPASTAAPVTPLTVAIVPIVPPVVGPAVDYAWVGVSKAIPVTSVRSYEYSTLVAGAEISHTGATSLELKFEVHCHPFFSPCLRCFRLCFGVVWLCFKGYVPLGVSLALYKDSAFSDSIPVIANDTTDSGMGILAVLTATVRGESCYARFEGAALSVVSGDLECRVIAHGCWGDPHTVRPISAADVCVV
jgi:hypothetical protein